jgi:hypothetical protein
LFFNKEGRVGAAAAPFTFEPLRGIRKKEEDMFYKDGVPVSLYISLFILKIFK